jgi:hypothetical protein
MNPHPDAIDWMREVAHQHLFNQFWLTLFFVIPMVLVARAVVDGTRYSAILIIVLFGLLMGFLLVATEVSAPGLADFPMMGMIAQSTIVALTATFFVGGQELRKLLGRPLAAASEDEVVYAKDEVFVGTQRTQTVFVLRAFFVLLGLEALTRSLAGTVPGTPLQSYYPLIAYLGLVIAVIFIDPKAVIASRRRYLTRGVLELLAATGLLLLGHVLAVWIAPTIALPQIFFVMLLAAGLGAWLPRWNHGPTIRCLLFAGIPVVLAANFVIGGSRIADAFKLTEMQSVIAYGFFGQILWMFGGIALILFLGRTARVRNIGPAMAGGLSHAGLTGACTAGDFGERAAKRAPIMINIPFFGHVFVFSILAYSIEQGALAIIPTVALTLIGAGLTLYALRQLRRAHDSDAAEVRALMQFSFGWQLSAVFGGLLLLAVAGMPMANALMATSSSLSHFGLFAAIQGGMAGETAASLMPFVFAMPFLVHPLVFFMFGKAMENDETMPARSVYLMTAIGAIGTLAALLM